MALAQDFFDDLRHRLVLVDGVLAAAGKQRHTGFKAHFVTGFVL